MTTSRTDLGPELGERFVAGDPAAFEEVMTRLAPGIYHTALGMLHSREDAEEVLQETFLTAHRKRATLAQPERLKSWLYRIAANHALMRLRSARRHPELALEELPDPVQPPVPWLENPEEHYAAEEFQALLLRALDDLPPLSRTIFWMRDVEGLTNQEVADILGLGLAAVKSRLLRARLVLREALSAHLRVAQRAGSDA